MPQVRIRKGLVGEDGQDWLPGEVHDASDKFARDIVFRRAAVLVEGEELDASPTLTTKALRNADPSPSHRDPRGRK